MAVPTDRVPNPYYRAEWSLPGAIKNFFGLSVQELWEEYRQMDSSMREIYRQWLVSEGYNIVGLAVPGPDPALLPVVIPAVQEVKKDVDAPNYALADEDPLSEVPEVSHFYAVGQPHPAVKA